VSCYKVSGGAVSVSIMDELGDSRTRDRATPRPRNPLAMYHLSRSPQRPISFEVMLDPSVIPIAFLFLALVVIRLCCATLTPRLSPGTQLLPRSGCPSRCTRGRRSSRLNRAEGRTLYATANNATYFRSIFPAIAAPPRRSRLVRIDGRVVPLLFSLVPDAISATTSYPASLLLPPLQSEGLVSHGHQLSSRRGRISWARSNAQTGRSPLPVRVRASNVPVPHPPLVEAGRGS